MSKVQYEAAGKDLLSTAERTLKDIWDSWASYMQMAFTLVALDNMPLLLSHRTSLTNVSRLLPGHTFNIQGLLRDLPDLSPELRKLERRGFVRPDNSLQSGYRPHAEVMLWFLAEELIRVLREEQTLKAWLAAQQWKGLLTQKEEEALKKAFKRALPLLSEGAQAFIRAAAKGAAQGIFQL